MNTPVYRRSRSESPLFNQNPNDAPSGPFARYPAWVIHNGLLPELARTSALNVLTAIVSVLPNRCDVAQVRRATLARLCGVCRKTIDRSLAILEALGIIAVDSGSDRGRCSRYRVAFDAPAPAQSEEPGHVPSRPDAPATHKQSTTPTPTAPADPKPAKSRDPLLLCGTTRHLEQCRDTMASHPPATPKRLTPQPPTAIDDARAALERAGVAEPMRSRLLETRDPQAIIDAVRHAERKRFGAGFVVEAVRRGWALATPKRPKPAPTPTPTTDATLAALRRRYELAADVARGDAWIALGELGCPTLDDAARLDPLNLADRPHESPGASAARLLEAAGVKPGDARAAIERCRAAIGSKP